MNFVTLYQNLSSILNLMLANTIPGFSCVRMKLKKMSWFFLSNSSYKTKTKRIYYNFSNVIMRHNNASKSSKLLKTIPLKVLTRSKPVLRWANTVLRNSQTERQNFYFRNKNLKKHEVLGMYLFILNIITKRQNEPKVFQVPFYTHLEIIYV